MPGAGEHSKYASLESAASQAIRAHLDVVATSPMLASSPRKARLLRYLCTRALAGEGEQVNEYAIGIDVFEKPPSFDPRIDSIVRTEMGRLRQKLKDYYAGEGQSSPVRIDLPLRSYTPAFTFHAGESAPAALPPDVKKSAPFRTVIVPALIIVSAVLLAVVPLWKIRGRTAQPIGHQTATIVVLPFLNLTGDSGKEYLGDSLTDELTEALAESKDLRVVARTSAFQFKGKNRDIREIGRALNAGTLLEGSISIPVVNNGDGHRVNHQVNYRVVVQLIRAADGYHFWSRTYEATLADLSRVESEIAVSTEQALLPDRKAANQTANQISNQAALPNPEAHDLYMRAIYQLQLHTADSLRESLRLSREAVRIDPQYARAHFAIARAANTLSAIHVISGREATQLGKAAAERALAIDPHFSDAHAYMALTTYVYDWNWPEAEEEFALALHGEGSHSQADSWYGWALMTRKRFDEARSQLQVAEELDPQSPNPRQNMVTDLIFAANLAAAKHEIAGIFNLYPKSLVAIRDQGWIAILENQCAAARLSAQNAADWYPEQGDKTGSPLMKVVCGKPEEARRQLEKMAGEKEFVSPYGMAQGYAALNDADHAIEYLEKSAADRESVILYLGIDTLFDPIRKDPRFLALEEKIGLIP